jgi:hypothetical protein
MDEPNVEVLVLAANELPVELLELLWLVVGCTRVVLDPADPVVGELGSGCTVQLESSLGMKAPHACCSFICSQSPDV